MPTQQQAQHTPGPWDARPCDRGDGVKTWGKYWIAFDGEGCVASVSKLRNAAANDRLIAAAPDLMAACELALECLNEILEDTDAPNGGRVVNPLIKQLDAAIAKAKGPLS